MVRAKPNELLTGTKILLKESIPSHYSQWNESINDFWEIGSGPADEILPPDARTALSMNAASRQTAIRNQIMFIIAHHWALVWLRNIPGFAMNTATLAGFGHCCMGAAGSPAVRAPAGIEPYAAGEMLTEKRSPMQRKFSSKVSSSHKP